MKQELIEAFATHADFYVGNEHWDKSPEERQRIWQEVYTKLVVQECLNLAKWEEDRFENLAGDAGYPEAVDCASTMANYQAMVRQHFEVA